MRFRRQGQSSQQGTSISALEPAAAQGSAQDFKIAASAQAIVGRLDQSAVGLGAPPA